MSLWMKHFINNFINIKRNRSPKIYINTYFKETSFILCKKGSLTIEASITVPIMIGFLAIIVFFFRIIQVQSLIEEAIIYTGREIAVESSVLSSEELLFLAAEAHMFNAIKNSEIEDYIEGGFFGIALGDSNFEGDTITLKATYYMKLPVSFFDIRTIRLTSKNSFRKWVGNEDYTKDDKYVYVTTNGKVYHDSTSCRVLDLSIKRMKYKEIETLRGENGQKYYACDRCVVQGEEQEIVYGTDYGRLYHQNVNCSFLKRTIHKILITETEGRKKCTYCYN